MKLRKAVGYAVFAAVLSGAIAMFSFWLDNQYFSSEVRKNATNLSIQLAFITLSDSFQTADSLLEDHINSKRYYWQIDEKFKTPIRSFTDEEFKEFMSDAIVIKPLIERKKNSSLFTRTSKKLENSLKKYDRSFSRRDYVNSCEISLICGLCLFVILWLLPISWYFTLSRIRELSAAFQGK